MSDVSRRSFLLTGASLLASTMAGCATTASTFGQAGGGGSKSITDNGAVLATPAAVKASKSSGTSGAVVPPQVVAMYAAVNDDRFPIRASNMALVPERFWRQEVADPTGEAPGTVIVNTTERFLYRRDCDPVRRRYRGCWLCMVGQGAYRLQKGVADLDPPVGHDQAPAPAREISPRHAARTRQSYGSASPLHPSGQ